MSTLVIAEHDNNNLKPATLNTVAAANVIGGAVHILIAGSPLPLLILPALLLFLERRVRHCHSLQLYREHCITEEE